eukprot:9017741-Pyramimonas_sp.AAC.1
MNQRVQNCQNCRGPYSVSPRPRRSLPRGVKLPVCPRTGVTLHGATSLPFAFAPAEGLRPVELLLGPGGDLGEPC